ncbi:MAG TPA: hypothetical protein EYG73_07660 [Arcobacter sp.]|nr:hypothetical protein [Arcobacter sp.]
MFKKNYSYIIVLSILSLLYFGLGYFYSQQKIMEVLLLDIFFVIGIYFTLFSVKFIMGIKLQGHIAEFKVTQTDGDADGIKTKGILYTYIFKYKNDFLKLESIIKSKFKYKIGDEVLLYFNVSGNEVVLVKDIYLRLLFSFFILYYPIKSLWDSII